MILLTCEHAGREVPAAYSALFEPYEALLASHRGWDPGALPIAEALHSLTKAPLITYPYTRLLVEPNRSLHHRAVFSNITRHLPREEKQTILNTYYIPYRAKVTQAISEGLSKGPVQHYSIHTFTPELNGEVRQADIGLLYDPASTGEKAIAHSLRDFIKSRSKLRVRLNYPYLGKADGFTTHLRRLFTAGYSGIEIEINQAIAFTQQQEIAHLLAESILSIQ